MEVKGKAPLAESPAILRYVGCLGKRTLYPEDLDEQLKINEVLGLERDFSRDWTCPLYMARKPEFYGHENLTKESQAELVKKLRTKFVEEKLPQYMKFYTDLLEKSGNKFMCGDHPTIADVTILPSLKKFTMGFIDFVPTTVLDQYSVVTDWMKRMNELPELKKWYSDKK